MPADTAETAVRNYLQALTNPDSLHDHDRIDHLSKQLHDAADPLERLRLRQQLLDTSEQVSVERYETAFITHAKAWADRTGVTAKAFTDEGIPAATLRKAGFRLRGRPGRTPTPPRQAKRRTRVTSEQVRAAIPAGPFTIADLQQASGASPAVVRQVVADAQASGVLRNDGPNPNHRGPGRAATIYHRT